MKGGRLQVTETETLTNRLARLVEKPGITASVVPLVAEREDPLLRPADQVSPSNAGEENEGPELLVPEEEFGGVDGTRTRDLRRDRPAF